MDSVWTEGAAIHKAIPWPRVARLILTALGVATLVLIAIRLGGVESPDARSYYEAHGEHLYLGTLGDIAYAYSPAFAQVIGPLQELPYAAFRSIIALAEFGALLYLFGPLVAFVIGVFQIAPMWDEIAFGGNIQIVAAALLVAGLRGGAWAWPFLMLSKVTPGIGIMWPLLRRDYRQVAIGLGLTGIIAAVSFVAAPHHWFEWMAWMTGQLDASGDRPFLPHALRLVIAIGIIVYASRNDRVWLVPLAAAIAGPEGGGHWLLLLAMWPLAQDRRHPAVAM